MTALEFRGKHGEALPVITHRHTVFDDVPLEIKTMFERAPRAGVQRANEHAQSMLDSFHAHFEPEEVVTAEALALAFYKHTDEVLDKKALFATLGYLVRERKFVRRTRGYYQLTPKDYVPEVKTLAPRAPRKPRTKKHKE